MQKKQIRMRETRNGSPDGITVNRYLTDETYTIPERLADVFLAQGWADETSPAREAEVPANPYAGLTDDELALAVLAHDPDADPDQVTKAIHDDRAAVVAALPEPATKPAAKKPRRRHKK